MEQDASQAASRGGRRAGRKGKLATPRRSDVVRGGLPGGQFQPLTPAQQDAINEAALTLLETVGMGNPTASATEILTAAGCQVSERGRILFPRALVEDTLAKAARRFVLHGQKEQHDLEPWGSNVYYGTAGAAVHLVDLEANSYEDSTAQGLYQAARIVDEMDNIHFFQRSMVARELSNLQDLDTNTLYASIKGTSKHVGTSFCEAWTMQQGLELLHYVAGGEEAFRKRPFVSQSNCFVVPPLTFAQEACGCLEIATRAGMPVLLLSAGQAGATAPASIVGAVTQAVAECLAGLVYVNAVVPGHPAIFGTWPFVSDLRTGAMSGGSPEQALITAACGQMAQYYDLTGGSAAGITDSKLPDAQSGYEKAYTNVLAGMAGVNLVYESAGMHASLLGVCLVSYIIDNDMLGACMRIIKGIDFTPESLAIEVITKTCLEGPGHYLGSDMTLSLMESEYLYPKLAERWSPKEWAEHGKPSLLGRARERMEAILAQPNPAHIPLEVQAYIEANFPIKF
jgi:trimethylamine--corrinoid protein Co-methyltransferase